MTQTSPENHLKKHLLTIEASRLFLKYGNGLEMDIKNWFMVFQVEIYKNPYSVDKRQADKITIDIGWGGAEECVEMLRTKMLTAFKKLGVEDVSRIEVTSAGEIYEDGVFKKAVTHG